MSLQIEVAQAMKIILFALCNSKGKNPGDVFFINPRPFPSLCSNCSIGKQKIKTKNDKDGNFLYRYCKTCGSHDLLDHFAAFPPELPLKILKCACPQQICTKCGIPRYPISKSISFPRNESRMNDRRAIGQQYQQFLDEHPPQITEYTKCSCNEKFKPGIVLDPFLGTGTVSVAAEQLGLEWIGIELNLKSIKISEKKLDQHKHKKFETFS